MDIKWKIAYYKTLQGSDPVYNFINGLAGRVKSKIINTIDLLEEFGIRLGLPHVKKLTGTSLWELRVLGGDNIRIFYVAITGKFFLLLHAYQKKKQKTERKEIKIAIERLKEYISRPN